MVVLPNGEYAGSRRCDLWLNPDQNYVMVRWEYGVERPGEPPRTRSITTTESRQVDGVWLPWRVEEIIPADPQRPETVTRYTSNQVTEASIGTVTEADLALEFPPETEVVDRINNQAWIVAEDGRRIPQPLHIGGVDAVVDPATGTVISTTSQTTATAAMRRPR